MSGSPPTFQAPNRFNDKGRPKGKSKGKGKGKGKGKSDKGKPEMFAKGISKGKVKVASWSKGKGKPKGAYQGQCMYPTMRSQPMMQGPNNPTNTSSSTSYNSNGKGSPSSSDIPKTVVGSIKRCEIHRHISHGLRTQHEHNLFTIT
jgi:hypothetical protein